MPYFHHFVDKVHDGPNAGNERCLQEKPPLIPALPRQVKSGYLLHHKKRLLGKDWKEMFVVLFDDSRMIWFRDRDNRTMEGSLRLLDSPDLIAAGKFVSRVPNAPDLPPACCNNLAIAISPTVQCKPQWFLTNSQDDLIDWMKAINSTLPPPPPPPLPSPFKDVSTSSSNSSSTDKQNGKMYIRQNTAYPIQTQNTAHPFQTQNIHDVQNIADHQPFRRRSLSDPMIYHNQVISRNHGGGEEMMYLAGVATCWGSGEGWLNHYSFCSTCAMIDNTAIQAQFVQGYDDEPDCEVGDTDVGGDFGGDFGF